MFQVQGLRIWEWAWVFMVLGLGVDTSLIRLSQGPSQATIELGQGFRLSV